jgi:hypothetical protein
MKNLNEQQIQVHMPVVAALLIVGNALALLAAVIVFVVFVGLSGVLGGIGVASGDPEAARVLPQMSGWFGLLGTTIALFLAAVSLPGIAAGIGLLARKSWARILAIVVAVIGLVHFPVGTLIGIYAIFVLMQDAAPSYFDSSKAPVQIVPRPV